MNSYVPIYIAPYRGYFLSSPLYKILVSFCAEAESIGMLQSCMIVLLWAVSPWERRGWVHRWLKTHHPWFSRPGHPLCLALLAGSLVLLPYIFPFIRECCWSVCRCYFWYFDISIFGICGRARKNQPYAAFLWSSFLYRCKAWNVLDTALIFVYFLGKPFKGYAFWNAGDAGLYKTRNCGTKFFRILVRARIWRHVRDFSREIFRQPEKCGVSVQFDSRRTARVDFKLLCEAIQEEATLWLLCHLSVSCMCRRTVLSLMLDRSLDRVYREKSGPCVLWMLVLDSKLDS